MLARNCEYFFFISLKKSMSRKFLVFILIIIVHFSKAQNEFITIWQPDIVSTYTVNVVAPFQANDQQIWFPGIGQNYTIEWEEVGYPANNGILTNVTSTNQVLIDFGPKREGSGPGTTYRVKVSNGNGVFQQIKSATYQLGGSQELYTPTLQIQGSVDKLLAIEQWGSINWTSMSGAFANCQRVQLTATDSPDLSNVTDASLMFFGDYAFANTTSMQNWNTATIQNFSYMFSLINAPYPYTTGQPPFTGIGVSNWNTSSATNMRYMFAGQSAFNQNLDSWDVSGVTHMDWMFALCFAFNQPLNSWDTSSLQIMNDMFKMAYTFNQPLNNWNTANVTKMDRAFASASVFNQNLNSWNVSNTITMSNLFNFASQFNQPLDNWDVSNVTHMAGMFSSAAKFNQPLNIWDVSNVTNMSNMFSGAVLFNQPLNSWNVSNVTSINQMFYDAASFNQPLGNWNIASVNPVIGAKNMLQNSGLNCLNYSSTIAGWADNPNTSLNVDFGSASPLQYSSNVVNKRDILVNNKNWIISGDTQGSCILSTNDLQSGNEIFIYPNPTSDFVYIENLKNKYTYQILDASGRIVKQNEPKSNIIDIQNLSKGNYILQIRTKDNLSTFKLIKK